MNNIKESFRNWSIEREQALIDERIDHADRMVDEMSNVRTLAEAGNVGALSALSDLMNDELACVRVSAAIYALSSPSLKEAALRLLNIEKDNPNVGYPAIDALIVTMKENKTSAN